MQTALFIGRFQPFHNGHLHDVKLILERYEHVIIGIGSSNEAGTVANPLTADEREAMIRKTLEQENISNYEIIHVEDVGNDYAWVEQILAANKPFHIVYSGNDWTLNCFAKKDLPIKKLELVDNISSTLIREMIKKDDRTWKTLVPEPTLNFLQSIEAEQRIKTIN